MRFAKLKRFCTSKVQTQQLRLNCLPFCQMILYSFGEFPGLWQISLQLHQTLWSFVEKPNGVFSESRAIPDRCRKLMHLGFDKSRIIFQQSAVQFEITCKDWMESHFGSRNSSVHNLAVPWPSCLFYCAGSLCWPLLFMVIFGWKWLTWRHTTKSRFCRC